MACNREIGEDGFCAPNMPNRGCGRQNFSARIAQDYIGPFYVSTVELVGMMREAYADMGGIFETMFFAPDGEGGSDGVGQRRHATEEDAVAFHEEVAARTREYYEQAKREAGSSRNTRRRSADERTD